MQYIYQSLRLHLEHTVSLSSPFDCTVLAGVVGVEGADGDSRSSESLDDETSES